MVRRYPNAFELGADQVLLDPFCGTGTTIAEAKGANANDRLSKTQIVQKVDFARSRYPKLILRPVGVQEMKDASLVFVEFTLGERPDEIKIYEMRRHKLVPMAGVPLEKQQDRA